MKQHYETYFSVHFFLLRESGELGAINFNTDIDLKNRELIINKTLSRDDGKIVIAYMGKEAMELDGENSDYYASIPRCIKGCQIAALFKYKGEKETRISLRSTEHANVGDLAAEFGGGGHWKASGCTIHESFADAEPLFVKAAEKYL